MATKITATELSKNLSNILNRAAYRGEDFIVERNGEAVAEIRPIAAKPRATAREIIAKIGHLKVPEGFGDVLEEIQASQRPVKSRSPWED